MLKKLKMLVPVLFSALASVQTHATVIAQGSVEWNFDTAPSTVKYLYSGGFFGSIMTFDPFIDTQAFLDANNSGSLTLGDSNLSATWDPATGNSSGSLKSVMESATATVHSVSFNTYALFEVYTDLLTFSYDYNFFGKKEVANDWLSFFVQAEVTDVNNDKIVYSDYDPSVSNFRSQMTGFPSGDALTATLNGSQNFSFGTVGDFRTWRIRSDFLMYGRDSVGATTEVPESNPLGLFLVSLIALIGLQKCRARIKG